MRMRSACFATLFCLFLSAPFLVFVTGMAGIALPSWLGSEDAHYLLGDFRKEDPAEHFNISGFISGDLQKSLEKETEEYVPARAISQNITARWQRDLIQVSNLTFGYEVIPTSYGTDTIIDLTNEKLLALPDKADASMIEKMNRFAGYMRESASKYPDINFYLYLVPDASDACQSPVASHISSSLDYPTIEASLGNEHSGYTWIDGSMSYEDYLQRFFKTDHHWTAEGSLDAYNRIAKTMDLRVLESADLEFEHFDTPKFFGSLSRSGRIYESYDEMTCYIAPGEDKLAVADVNGLLVDNLLVHDYVFEHELWDKNIYADRYCELYHKNVPLITIENSQTETDRELLVLGDSFSNSLERHLALNYRMTYVIDSRGSDETLSSFLSTHPNVRDVLIIMRRHSLMSQPTYDLISK